VRRGRAMLMAGALLSVVLLLLTTALMGLRDPERTTALATELASEPLVQRLVADSLTEELLADAGRRLGPTGALLLPPIRPGVERFVRATVSSEAGQAALASALTDTIRHLSVRGPTVIDLRAAVDAAVATAPEELRGVLATLLDGRTVGLLVIDAASDAPMSSGTDGARAAPAERRVEPGTIAGVPSGVAVALMALVALGLLVPLGPRDAGIALLAASLPVVLALWLAPEVATGLLGRGLPADGLIGRLAPMVAAGVDGLLDPVRLVAGLLAMGGAALVVAARLRSRTT
jgi:hypothetical protein